VVGLHRGRPVVRRRGQLDLLSHERGLSCQANAGSAFYCQERWENRRSPPLRLSRLGGAIVYAHRFGAPCGASRWPRRLQRLGRRSVRSLELRLGTVCRSVAVGSAFLPMMTAVHNPARRNGHAGHGARMPRMFSSTTTIRQFSISSPRPCWTGAIAGLWLTQRQKRFAVSNTRCRRPGNRSDDARHV
jgi:hypothetical protein